MTDERHIPAENPEAAAFDVAEEPAATNQEAPACKPRRPWWQTVLIGMGAFIATIVVFGLAVYNFGGMSKSVYDPGIRQSYTAMVAAGQAQPVQKRFVIKIPGCNCHSTDPIQTEVHRYYRMRDCADCHSR